MADTAGETVVVDPDTSRSPGPAATEGKSVTAIANHLGIGRSALYRALAQV